MRRLRTLRGNTVNEVTSDFRFAEHPDQGLLIVSSRLSTDCKQGENRPEEVVKQLLPSGLPAQPR